MSADEAVRAASAIDAQRLWSQLMRLGAIGAIGGGGVCRLALSESELAARRHIVEWALARGHRIFVDEAANLFVRRDGTDGTAAPIVTGSHIDTQPQGGRFDGAYGVMAGLEVIAALDAASIRTRRPIEVVAWTNEEGVRYSPGAMGSMVFSGAIALASIAGKTDADGIPLAQALADARDATPQAVRRDRLDAVAGYVEAHIEQGPRLELSGVPIGVVDGIQGVRWFDISVDGVAAHAGTTPMTGRRDALQTAVRIIQALNAWTADPADLLRFTVGRLDVLPNSRNTVPSRVSFGVDLRHPDAGVLKDRGDRIANIAREHAGDCRVGVEEVFAKAPAVFNRAVVAVIEASARQLGIATMRMSSGAFHDALFLNGVCPTGMIFIPCERGVSHNPAENITPTQAADGARVLAATLVSLAA